MHTCVGSDTGKTEVTLLSLSRPFSWVKENIFSFCASLQILTLEERGEQGLESQEERQGKMLLHTEYSLLSLLHTQDGVVHHHGLFQVGGPQTPRSSWHLLELQLPASQHVTPGFLPYWHKDLGKGIWSQARALLPAAAPHDDLSLHCSQITYSSQASLETLLF